MNIENNFSRQSEGDYVKDATGCLLSMLRKISTCCIVYDSFDMDYYEQATRIASELATEIKYMESKQPLVVSYDD